MNYSALATQFKKLVRDFGEPVKITRLGEKVLSDYVVFEKQIGAEDTSSPLSSISRTNVTTCVAYVPFNKSAPIPGDTVTTKSHPEYVVTSVETYQPGATVVGFKLELQ